MRENAQLELLEEFRTYYRELPFGPQKKNGLRYYFDNTYFSYADGIVLYCMLRHIRPRKLIEVGSGFSSSVTLDTNELFFNSTITLTFIEPYPISLLSLMKESDKTNTVVIQKKLQDVDPLFFSTLSAGDILFMDSTHISKTNSDVNYMLFEIFPRLAHGVHIHIHDIFFPFEYLREWVYEGRAWNEAYILRAFLYNNNEYEIEFFNHFMSEFHPDRTREALPLYMNQPGASLWLRKK